MNVGFLEKTGIAGTSMVLTIGVSILCHVILFGIIILFPGIQVPIINPTPVINIDLVSMSVPEPEPEVTQEEVPDLPTDVQEPKQEEVIEKPEPVKKEPEPEIPQYVEPKKPPPIKIEPLKPKEEVVLDPKPETKEQEKQELVETEPKKIKQKYSLKKRTLKSKKLVTKAIKPKKKIDSVKKAIEKLRIKDRRRTFLSRRTTNSEADMGLMKIYQAEIQAIINNNWAFSEQLVGGNNNLKSVLMIKINKNGKILDYWFEDKSGNSFFDNSVINAVKKSNPLPRLPAGYIRPEYNVGLIFSPSGLKKGFIN